MVSPIGYILTLASIVLFVRSRRSLLWGTLFLAPFTNLEVLFVGVTTIKGYQLFGVLLIIRFIFDSFVGGKKGIKKSWANVVGALFLLVCFASISMATLNSGSVEVYTNVSGMWPEIVRNSVPLELSAFNFTQVLFPTFGIFLFYCLVRELRTEADLRKAVNILVWGGLVVAGMSIASGLLYTIGRGNIYWGMMNLFTVGPPSNFGAPRAASVGQFLRSYTIAGEPGFTAVSLLLGTGLVIGDLLGPRRSPVVSSPILKLSILTVALLLNGSTTGYFGATLLVIWTLLAPWYVGRVSLGRIIQVSGYVLGGVAVLMLAVSTIRVSGMPFYDWLINYHLAKVQGEAVGSGNIRSYVTWYTLTEVFPSSPIFGVGYGSHRSLSLASFLLANVGVVGFSVFLLFIYIVFQNARRVSMSGDTKTSGFAFMSLIAIVPLIATLFVAKSTSGMNYGVTWSIIALAEATYQVHASWRRTARQSIQTK